MEETLADNLKKAIKTGRLRSINLRESDCDGDQDLNMVTRCPEYVVREIMGDPRLKGHQHYCFKMVKKDGMRVFGETNTALIFEQNQIIAGDGVCPIGVCLYIDNTWGKVIIIYNIA